MTDKSELISPDHQQKLLFNSPSEPKPGVVMSKFVLASLTSKAKMQFPGILSMGEQGNTASWSGNAQFFSLAVGVPFDCFLMVDTQSKLFAVVKVRNIRVLNATCGDEKLVVNYADTQGSDKLKPKKYPTRQFINPAKLTFKFSDLKWYEFDHLENFKTLAKELKQHDLLPIDNGWQKFEGTLPQTTELTVWELKEFAKYGDPQSEIWLKELMTRTDDPNLSIKTSDYIGIKKRS